MSMADHLSVVAADYTATELSVAPQRVMTERSDKKQVVYEADDGTIAVVSKSDSSIFTVTLQWDVITSADKETIEDLYNDSAKANARENTFYWHHPKETDPQKIYTVRFMTPLEVVHKVSMPSHFGINQVTFRVHGKKS